MKMEITITVIEDITINKVVLASSVMVNSDDLIVY